MKYNNELKCINTQEKAYLLGQIYGDGYTGESGHSFKTMLASINSDRELYIKLYNLFPFFKLKEYSSKPNMIYLENYEKALTLDLNSIGMKSSKTLYDKTGEFHFPNIKDELISHFIRGYFDADGSFWFPKRCRSRNNLRTEFGCATKNFLLAIKKYLDSKDIRFTYCERSKKDGGGNYHMSYTLFSSSRELSIKFRDLIYKDSTVHLQYKYDISHTEKDIITADEIFGNCPYCNSSNVIKNGIRNGKHRLKCKNCGKNYTKEDALLTSNSRVINS